MTYNVDGIKDRINTMAYGNYDWEGLVEAFTEEDVEVMREYFLNSDIPFDGWRVDLNSDCIYAFMRLMAAEYIIDDEGDKALNICDFLYGEF